MICAGWKWHGQVTSFVVCFFVLTQLPFVGVKVQVCFRGSSDTDAQPLVGMRDICGISNLGY